MTNLEWRTVEGFPDYEVSNMGDIRSWRRKKCVWRKSLFNPGRRKEPKILKCATDKWGYRRAMIRDANGKIFLRTVHRLVAKTFIPNPDNLPDAAHNNGKPGHDEVANLRWASRRDNQLDMWKHGTMQAGEKCVAAKITQAQAAEIHMRAQIRGAGIRLAREFGLSKAQVSRIRNLRRWRILAM